MAAPGRHVAMLQGCLAVVAALALLMTPVTASTGAQIPHAHALIHLLLDGADGSFDHHSLGAVHGAAPPETGVARPPVGGTHHDATRPLGEPADGVATADALDPGVPAAPLDDLPVVTSLSMFATAAATPVADLLAHLVAPAPMVLLLAWGAPRLLAGIAARPTSPPPRAVFAV